MPLPPGEQEILDDLTVDAVSVAEYDLDGTMNSSMTSHAL
jgi:hypothetical protein